MDTIIGQSTPFTAPALRVLLRQSMPSSSHHASDLADGLFFIVGAPRSGTTLLQAVLSSHSRLAVGPETEFFMKYDGPSDGEAWEDYLERLIESEAWHDQDLSTESFVEGVNNSDRSARAAFLAIMSMQAQRLGKPRIGEKSPHHCRHVMRILELFPAAKIVHVYRDPRDVVASRIRMPWSAGSYLAVAREWDRIIGEHQRLKRELPTTTYRGVAFESLTRSPEAEVRGLCDFLGEEFEPGMLAFHDRLETGYARREAAWKGGTRLPISPVSVGRYFNDLTARQIAGVERIAGESMDALGYKREHKPTKMAWLLRDTTDDLGNAARRWGRSLRKRVVRRSR